MSGPHVEEILKGGNVGIEVRRAEYGDIAGMRELYRAAANCQIVHDSVLRRGLADPYLILDRGRPIGYMGVWSRYHPGRVMEYHVVESMEPAAISIFRDALQASGATQIEAQTNMPRMLEVLERWGADVVEEKVLFEDDHRTNLRCPGGIVRRAEPSDQSADIEWVLEMAGRIVARGGVLSHYNPPYWDVYMEVEESVRRQGYGSYIVQELKNVCYAEGMKPAARCDPSNAASRRTLEKAGFRACGRLLVGTVRSVPR